MGLEHPEKDPALEGPPAEEMVAAAQVGENVPKPVHAGAAASAQRMLTQVGGCNAGRELRASEQDSELRL